MNRVGPALLLVLVSTSVGNAITRHVPSEFATIQTAVDSSAVGDTVLVAPGTYSDVQTRDLGTGFLWSACVFMKDGVILKSEAGRASTTIDMQQAPGPQPDVIIMWF